MPKSPDDPPSGAARSAAPAATEPASHLVCAYSPRWLSGPTPAFEGLVATWSATDEPEGSSHTGAR